MNLFPHIPSARSYCHSLVALVHSFIHPFSEREKRFHVVELFLAAFRCKIICSNFSLNSPRSSQVAGKRKETEKINDPEDSVKNASLPYIIAIKKKKNNKMIKCKKFTLLRFRSPALALQLVIYFARNVLEKKLMEKVWHFTLCFLSFARVLSGVAEIFIWISFSCNGVMGRHASRVNRVRTSENCIFSHLESK